MDRTVVRLHNCKSKQVNRVNFVLLVVAVFAATIKVILVDAIECGTVDMYHITILGGDEVKKDEWPFIAALYYSDTSQYFCGGTIITQKHVLTAAHCLQKKDNVVPRTPDKITVRLGAFNLTDPGEQDVVYRNVTEIFVHHDWKFDDVKYDADIAVLVLDANVTFSNHIRPVCMPPTDFLIDGLLGTVVGWGKIENGTAEGIPRKIEVDALNDTYCYGADNGIARFVSERSFCGESYGTPNEGDSGGGFFAVAGSGWVQFGTVSFIRPKPTKNTTKIAVYTKLIFFRDWIAQTVEQSGGNISLATTKANLNCSYSYTKSAAYGCYLFDLNIRQENFVVKNITGSHYIGKDNEDVESAFFRTGVMASIPRNFGNIFKNLKTLEVSLNTWRISRSNLLSLERLEFITLFNTVMTHFDENSLWDLSNLRAFGLVNSKLKSLQAAMFSRNNNLTSVYVRANDLLMSLPANLFENNLLLDRAIFNNNAIEYIDDDVFHTNTKLRVVSFKGNRLRHLSENLFRNNFGLEIIDLSENRIKTIDEQSFQANSKLLTLQLDSNELKFLPAQLLQSLKFLEKIYIETNLLKAIDEHFFETNLDIKEISLMSNKLTRIHTNQFRNNRLLEAVDLSTNFIESIDGNLFEGNPLLRKVGLAQNFLFELPWNLFSHNAMLEIVYAETNSLQIIDERTFEWNTRLREIHFDFNRATFLHEKLFHNNSLLETVHFQGNSLEAIDEHIFETNANLQAVYLDKNYVNYLPVNLFRNNPLLEVVSMANNFKMGKVGALPKDLFQGNPRLKSINFSNNYLQYIETDFTTLKNVELIDLSENSCIDIGFYDGEIPYSLKNEVTRPKWTLNLTEFQELVTANCPLVW